MYSQAYVFVYEVVSEQVPITPPPIPEDAEADEPAEDEAGEEAEPPQPPPTKTVEVEVLRCIVTSHPGTSVFLLVSPQNILRRQI